MMTLIHATAQGLTCAERMAVVVVVVVVVVGPEIAPNCTNIQTIPPA